MVVGREIVGGGPVYRSVFVFGNITAPKPTLLFKVVHLYHGEVIISGYNTLLTGEVDLNSAINKGKADTQMTVDLFREFKWSDGAGTLTQTASPAFFRT